MTGPAEIRALATALVGGDRRALARTITLIEREPPARADVDALIAPATGNAYTIGITGAPGAGKSTLVGALLLQALAADRRVAVLALDPESPLSRGAILGDRLRMEQAAADPRVYVRSLTAHAHGGGLSATTPLVVRAIDAAGWPWVLLETVGVGQTELDIVDAASTTVVVLNPGWGDEVQAVKAGLMEVGDVFVINKADRDGVEQTRFDLEQLLRTSAAGAWRAPIVETVASEGRGIDEVWAAINAHRAHLEQAGDLARRRQRFLRLALRSIATTVLSERVDAALDGAAGTALLESVSAGGLSVPEAALRLVAKL